MFPIFKRHFFGHVEADNPIWKSERKVPIWSLVVLGDLKALRRDSLSRPWHGLRRMENQGKKWWSTNINNEIVWDCMRFVWFKIWVLHSFATPCHAAMLNVHHVWGQTHDFRRCQILKRCWMSRSAHPARLVHFGYLVNLWISLIWDQDGSGWIRNIMLLSGPSSGGPGGRVGSCNGG